VKSCGRVLQVLVQPQVIAGRTLNGFGANKTKKNSMNVVGGINPIQAS
jgi:hypothetical protein